jgi:hypothetical protein
MPVSVIVAAAARKPADWSREALRAPAGWQAVVRNLGALLDDRHTLAAATWTYEGTERGGMRARSGQYSRAQIQYRDMDGDDEGGSGGRGRKARQASTRQR